MKIILLSLALGAPLASPVADVVPTWNVQASCQGAVAADAALKVEDVQSVDSCMKDESQAREELTKVWMSYSGVLRTRCEKEAGENGPASYVDLIVCLQTFADNEPKPAVSPTVTSLKGASKTKRKTPPK